MSSSFSFKEFVLHPPAEFALLGLPSGELKIFLGPFSAFKQLQIGKPNIYLNDFFLNSDSPFLIPQDVYSVDAIDRKLAEQLTLSTPPQITWSKKSQSEFIESFIFFRDLLEKGILSKAVPISFLEGILESQEILSSELSWFIRKLAIGQPGLYSYAFKNSDFTLIGASPEVLFTLDKSSNLITSEAVAGSIISGHAPLSQITGKLKEEHELVVIDLVKQLSVFGEVVKGEVSLKSLSSLCHLRTPLEVASNSEVNISKLIRLLHPSGALGILPRADLDHSYLKALDLSGRRKFFGAPFGAVFEDGAAAVLVAIRNLMITKNNVQLGAGAGITKQSEQNSELEEVLAKQHSVKVFFGLA